MTAGASRLRELGERWSLDSRQLATLERIVAMLVSDPLAPSAVAPDAVLDVHVADSLSALALPQVTRARTVADLGSGAGFPGLALAVALPRARVALVESVSRKCRFLERVCSGAGVENAHVVHARAERWPDGLGRHDLVTARALAPLAVLCEYAAPLLASGGTLVAWKGEIGLSEAQMGERAAPRCSAWSRAGWSARNPMLAAWRIICTPIARLRQRRRVTPAVPGSLANDRSAGRREPLRRCVDGAGAPRSHDPGAPNAAPGQPRARPGATAR